MTRTEIILETYGDVVPPKASKWGRDVLIRKNYSLVVLEPGQDL